MMNFNLPSTPRRNITNTRNHRHGLTIIYIGVSMIVICLFLSYMVDLGRIKLAKAELQRTVDSAARAGANEIGREPSVIRAAALKYANNKANVVDDRMLNLTEQDVEIGIWDTNTLKFTSVSDKNYLIANAVRVSTVRKGKDAIPLFFGKAIGQDVQGIRAHSVAMYIPGVNVNQKVDARANPFLAGMPAGTKASTMNPKVAINTAVADVAGNTTSPKNSPVAITMAISEGMRFNFDSISGTAQHDPKDPYFEPDGKMSDIGHNNVTSSHANNYSNGNMNEHGIADMRAPINSLVGVFLSDESPNKSSPPKNLDFSSAVSRDFAELKPELKQIFWIGDGKNKDGVPQQFVAPKGATRLYLATWDFYEWNNNDGERIVKVIRPGSVVTVE